MKKKKRIEDMTPREIKCKIDKIGNVSMILGVAIAFTSVIGTIIAFSVPETLMLPVWGLNVASIACVTAGRVSLAIKREKMKEVLDQKINHGNKSVSKLNWQIKDPLCTVYRIQQNDKESSPFPEFEPDYKFVKQTFQFNSDNDEYQR